MPVDFEKLKAAPRILIEASLKPVAGTRIQPTGFPELGPATYDAPDDKGGTVSTLLVESAQSMANRLEAVCWDEATDNLAPELMVQENGQKVPGLPYVRVNLAGLGDGTDTTASLLEFHRLNSPYIMSGVTKAEIKLKLKPDGGETTFAEGSAFGDVLKPQLGLATAAKRPPARRAAAAEAAPPDASDEEKERDDVAGVVNLRKLATVCFKYDPNSLVHGVFLEKIAGRLRHPRALSSFIEASGVDRADSGGVKFDRVLPKPKVAGVDAKGGYGNVPFHRTEFTAKSITAFFSIDLAQIRGYGLPAEASELLIVLSLWKVRQFLNSNMRLRAACELEIDEKAKGIQVKRPDGFAFPPATELASRLADLMAKCKPYFADPTVTILTWNNPKG